MQFFRITLILSMSFMAGACVAFFPPDEEDDGVIRCDTSQDCNGPEYDDSRITGQCVDAAEDNAPKVCVAGWAPTNCNATSTAISGTFDEAAMSAAYVTVCSADNLGKPGCSPDPQNGCDMGEATTVDGVLLCPHPDAGDGWVAVPPTDAYPAGRDVQDQACRYFFCNRNFVCNADRNVCQLCDPNLPPGKGGCAEMYIEGERAQILMSNDQFPGEGECASHSFGNEKAWANGVNGSM